MSRRKTILVFGTFDVENYGDLLFPLIARHRLSTFADVRFVSPVGNDRLWSDCIQQITTNEAILGDTGVDGVLVGGGNVIHGPTGDFTPYNQHSAALVHAYPDIWFGAAYVAAMHNCPLLFNAPGVSLAVKESPLAEFLKVAIDLSEYVNARDASGATVLQTVSPNANISVTPDTAMDVAQLWSKEELSDAYRQAFLSRGESVPNRTLAVHVRKTSLPRKLGPISQRLDQIAKQTGTVPIIISFGECHRDDDAVREVASQMRCNKLLLDRPNSLLEITACLAHSVGYLGSSFHGCLVASAFRRPSQLVVLQPQPKHMEAGNVLLSSNPPLKSWLDADPKVFPENTVAGNVGVRSEVFEKLDQHWELIQHLLVKGSQTNKQQKMNEFRAEQRGVDVQSQLSLNDYISLIEPLKQANLAGLVRRCARQRSIINALTNVPPTPKHKARWIRRLSWKLRSYR